MKITYGKNLYNNLEISSVVKQLRKTTQMGTERILFGKKIMKVVNESFEENTRKVISNATSDPVMASLLEDTANTTLQEQNSADSSNRFAAKATDSYSRAVDSSDPVELFGEASNNWAALAFSGNK